MIGHFNMPSSGRLRCNGHLCYFKGCPDLATFSMAYSKPYGISQEKHYLGMYSSMYGNSSKRPPLMSLRTWPIHWWSWNILWSCRESPLALGCPGGFWAISLWSLSWSLLIFKLEKTGPLFLSSSICSFPCKSFQSDRIQRSPPTQHLSCLSARDKLFGRFLALYSPFGSILGPRCVKASLSNLGLWVHWPNTPICWQLGDPWRSINNSGACWKSWSIIFMV